MKIKNFPIMTLYDCKNIERIKPLWVFKLDSIIRRFKINRKKRFDKDFIREKEEKTKEYKENMEKTVKKLIKEGVSSKYLHLELKNIQDKYYNWYVWRLRK